MFLLIIASLVSCTFSTASNHTYMVVHPSYVRPNSDFLVHVELFKKIVNSESITAEFVTNEVNDARISALKTKVFLKPGMLGTDIILSIPADFESKSYQLEVNGTEDVIFNASNQVYCFEKSMSIFIQTDKAQYKPGQIVQYRVFAVDSGLKPKSVVLNIEIFDSKGNKLSETNDVQDIFGTAGSFQLSDMPVQGSWSITANVKGTEIQESFFFEVEEYVLPKFEVTIQFLSFGTSDNPSLSGMVKARYTFGKPVQGVCLLRVERQYSRSFHDPVAVHTQITINGEGSFSIPISVLKRLSRNIERDSFSVTANVTETLTGITESGDATITFYSERSMAYPEEVDVEFAPYMKKSFKPGFPYHVAVKVTRKDGRPLVNPTESLKIEVTYFTKTAISGNSTGNKNDTNIDPEFVGPFPDGEVVFVPSMHYTPSPDGFVTFDMDIPDYVFTASILAQFAGRKVYKDVICFQSPSRTFLNVELLTKSPEIGKHAIFSITGSKSPGEVTYHILSKSFVSLTGKVTVVQSSVAQTFNVLITSDMAPTARILVYYVTSDGEIVADGLYFTVQEMFQNKVDITFSKTRSQPGENVDVQLKADPDSLICVLAVDKSVLLLGTGNDITEKRVREDLATYDYDRILFASGWGILQTWPIPADDASDIFIQAGFTISTDGILHKFNLWSLNGVMSDAVRYPYPELGVSNVDAKDVGTAHIAAPRVRKFFPETMIFTSITADANGIAKLIRTVPDTITEWVASAFALNVNSGLGIAAMTANLTVFQNFFVNLQLPYSVVRGEVAIQANVFNYYDTDEYVLVTLKGSNDFDGIIIDGSGTNENVTGDLVQCVQVKSNEPTVVFFTITPKSIGSINLHVRAESRRAADALMTPLLVKAEGEPKEYNRPVLISLQTVGTFSEEVHITYPQNVVEGSQSVRVTLIGDILGPSLENLDDLIQLPYGCGEQNMLNFAPSVYAAQYLKKTSRLPEDSVKLEDIRLKLRTGYQRELVYQRFDGSFSAFGDADESGSIWLTAFVGKSFAQATDLIFIDPRVIEDLVNYINMQQSEDDGLFSITGIVHHRAIQGGSAESKRSLSAYICIALKEIQAKHISMDESHFASLNKVIATAATALANSETELTTEYEMAIIAYALSLTEKYTANARSILNTLVQSLDVVNEGGIRHWKNDSQSLQIEIAAYALLAYTELRDTENGLPVLRWLIKQRNPYGGFVSTQDTVIAIQSLSSFAGLTYSPVVDILVTLRVGSTMETLTLNRDNNDVLTLREFSGTTDLISVTATGTGMGLLEVGVFYNVFGESEPASFTLTLETSEEIKNSFILTACTSWTEVGYSGMVLLDIGVPSGFAADKSSVVMLSEMKRIEESSGRLVMYFDQVTSEKICVGVTIRRESIVAKVQAATVRVFSYYDPDKRTVKSYLPISLKYNSWCDICGTECGCGPGTIGIAKELCTNALHSNT